MLSILNYFFCFLFYNIVIVKSIAMSYLLLNDHNYNAIQPINILVCVHFDML